MRAVNLFIQTRVGEASFREAYKAMSLSAENVKPHEYEDLRQLVTHLMNANANVSMLDGFWYSYRIPHISKEFDLLKIEEGNLILNIELKSQDIGKEKILKQLLQNRSYLKHLKTPIESFTYVSELQRLYRLENGELRLSDFAELTEVLDRFHGQEIFEDLDAYFKPNNFLVSPLTQPERLLRGEYFLTDQQERFKIEILEEISHTNGIYGITGEPGTGKTLLLYDIALELSKHGRCCMIHGAALSEGHIYIHEHCEALDILSPRNLTTETIEAYDYILVDEMQRIYLELSDKILSFLSKKPIIVSFDREQILSAEEEKRAITERVKMLNIYHPYQLTNSLRINKQIAMFYRLMFDWKEYPRGEVDFRNIELVYAENEEDARQIVRLYTEDKGYRFLYCTCHSDQRSFLSLGTETHRIIGQEYDYVLTMIDEHFYYDKNGRLNAVPHENGTYDYVRMLYQNVTRTREKLCLLIYRNPEIFAELLEMKNRDYHKDDKKRN